MKRNTLFSLLTFSTVVTALITYAALTDPGNEGTNLATKTSATMTAPPTTESSARINVKALADNLDFLGEKPVLAGRPLLIEFWATWCPPCRASIAHLNELDKKFHNQGLNIVGISDQDKSVVERFRTHTPMNYSVALDTNQTVSAQFQVRTIPQAWLFDKDGRVVWSGHPMELDGQTIDRALSGAS